MEKHKDTCMVSGRDATMKTYLVTAKVVMYETWEVEAENKAKAVEKYTEGDFYFEKRSDTEVVEVVEVQQLGGKDNG